MPKSQKQTTFRLSALDTKTCAIPNSKVGTLLFGLVLLLGACTPSNVAPGDAEDGTAASRQGSSPAGDPQTDSAAQSDTTPPETNDSNWVEVSLDETSSAPVEVFDLSNNDHSDPDKSHAVDDDIWRQMDLAGEYYSMGLIANQEGSWDEAQFHFERSLKILGELDIDEEAVGDSSDAEWRRYNGLLENIVAAYNVTLLSLGKLPAEISTSAMMERFEAVENILLDKDTLATVREEIDTAVVYDMPIKMNDRVKASIRYFQTDARDAFLRYWSRSTRYLPMLKEIVRSYGLPEDLVYLPLVESGYNTSAYSWAKAMGLWQFISSTGRLYDLRRSWWYDERRDPVKATHAACKYLKWLYKEFGDWELAMAAYNAGPGKVRRTMKRDKTSNYWKLRHLRRETRNYIPLYMAATIIMKNPAKYGFNESEVEFLPELEFDEVVIDRALEFKTIARELGVTVKEIAELNPELLRKHTPPKTKKYKLKVPAGSKHKFLASYPTMESPQETSWVKHKIRRGETVSTIAARYGVSQYAIREANNLRTSRIYAGKVLIVPVPLDDNYASGRSRTKRNAQNGVYVVRRGDSIYEIARSFKISMRSLKDLNGIGSSSRIYVGQKLKIPGQSGTGGYASASSGKSSKSRKSGSFASLNDNSGDYLNHKVRRGENLTVIAKRYGVSVSQLRRWNRLGASAVIYPGQKLSIKTAKAPGRSTDDTYKVKRGDSLWKIARKFGLSTSKLIAWNGLNNGDIRPGQTLRLSPPGGSRSGKTLWHTVRKGENLTVIASLYNTTVSRIAAENNIRNPRRLRAGDKLRIRL